MKKRFAIILTAATLSMTGCSLLGQDTYYIDQGRRNLDGYRMYYNPEMLEDLFDAGEVFDKSRPTPVPEM